MQRTYQRLSPFLGRRSWTAPRATTALLSLRHTHDGKWAEQFKAATVDLASMDVDNISYQDSAERLRTLLKSGLLKHTDLNDNPERFFLAHRLLAEKAPQLGKRHIISWMNRYIVDLYVYGKIGPGFWIRFTVHYNLCAGTVLALGSDEQCAQLQDMQEKGLLGCFSLTEKLAGVSSGMVVNTVAEYDKEERTFTLNSVGVGGEKNWISQGLVADKSCVVADLKIDGKSYGPHGFFIDFRVGGEVVPGIVHGDMGRKTVGNDLDNAWIKFDNLKVSKEALLNRFADITADGEYLQKVAGIPVFHRIGQRLFSGRVAVAQAALEFRRAIFESTKAYADQKECWAPKGTVMLSQLPQLRAIFAENEEKLAKMDAFVGKCESELCKTLRENSTPSLRLVEAIACAKVKAVEESIDLVHRLQNEVGSYALMRGSGFEQSDFLTCCKFAEGDSRILMQKMSRDITKELRGKTSADGYPHEAVFDLANQLNQALEEKGQVAWDENWQTVYKLADEVMEAQMQEFMKA